MERGLGHVAPGKEKTFLAGTVPSWRYMKSLTYTKSYVVVI
jgi:hypothetical protein